MNPQVMQMDPRVLQIQQQQHMQQNPGVGPIQGGPPGMVAGPDGDGSMQQGQKPRRGRPSKNAVNKLAVRTLSHRVEFRSQKVDVMSNVVIYRLKRIISR